LIKNVWFMSLPQDVKAIGNIKTHGNVCGGWTACVITPNALKVKY